jgi:hypothetical protein
MSGFDWKGTIGKVAPALAGILGSPAAGVAVSGLCQLFGLEPSTENAQIVAEKIAAGQMSGDQLVQLKKIETDALLQLKKLGLDYDLQSEQIITADRANARNREIQVKDKTPEIGFYLVTAGFFGMLSMLFFRQIPPSAQSAFDIMLGALAVAWGNQVKYYYGGGGTNDANLHSMLFKSTPPSEGGDK